MGRYPIMSDNRVVGHADVQRQGLFYVIRCSCRLYSNELLRVCIVSKSSHIKLGVLVPDAGQSVCCSRVAESRIKDTIIQFVIEKYNVSNDVLIQDEIIDPADLLTKLDDAYLRRNEGTWIVAFKDNKD